MDDECFSGFGSDTRIKVLEVKGEITVILKGQYYMGWKSGDEVSARMAIAQLYQGEMGTEEDLARAFGRHVNSIHKYVTQFKKEGIEGLLCVQRGPRARWKVTQALRAKILLITLREGIEELEDIQKRLKELWNEDVSLSSIRQVLLENGLTNERPRISDLKKGQGDFFVEETQEHLALKFNPDMQVKETETEEKVEAEDCKEKTSKDDQDSYDGTNPKRHYSPAQRIYLDRLEVGNYNAYAGGLLFTPLLEQYSFLPTFHRIIDLPTYEGYSLDELCQTLFYLDVFGFHSMEDFKRAYPEEFGVLVGRTQSPSLFTLRRFLHKVKALEIGERLIDTFALEYLKSGIAKWGTLYIDGHFLPYHGISPISKGWHAVRQMPMKGSYNFIGVDEKFRPWLFLIRSSSEDLLEKIPEMIKKARKITEGASLKQEDLKQLIVIFDREGYSAELYRYLDARDKEKDHERVIFISWAKYADKWVHDIPEEKFDKTACVNYEIKKAESIKYFQMERTMNKFGKIRTIVIQGDIKERRSAIFTNGNETEIKAESVIELICRRWGQENLIKELLNKHQINYMPGYVIEEIEEQPMVDNPKIKALKKDRAVHIQELNKLKIQLANQVLKKGEEHANWAQIHRNAPEISGEIVALDSKILLLNQEIDKLPAQLRYEEVHDGEKLQKLNYEKKRFLDCIKIFTYNIKEKMCQILLKHYPSRRDVLSALAMIVARAGYIKLEDGQLNVQLKSFQDREINYAARHLCEDLNHMKPRTLDKHRFPIRYDVL